MRSILVVSKEQEPSHTILECFGRGYRVDKASTQDAAMEMLRKKRYDFVFIDVEILRESVSGNGYKAALQLFWHVYPSIEIVVMSSQEMIRKVVMAVKARASNCLTYPASADEVKYVTESVQESLIVQSELDYLRDQSWQSDSLEFVQTESTLINGPSLWLLCRWIRFASTPFPVPVFPECQLLLTFLGREAVSGRVPSRHISSVR